MFLPLVACLVGTAGAVAPPPDAGATKQLPDAPGLLDRWDGHRAWGTPLLVSTLLDVSERLAWEHPELDPLTIGDISTRGGGPMYGHKTHHLGVDADVGLFTAGGRQPRNWRDLHPRELDVVATWRLIQALLDTGNVQFILLDERHMARLRVHLADDLGWTGDEIDAVLVPPDTRLSADLRGVIRHAPNHASHLHVRITSEPLKDTGY